MALFGSIRSRVLFGTLALALIPLLIAAGVIAFLSYQSARDTVTDRVQGQLTNLRTVQSQQLQSYFVDTGETLRVLASNPTTIGALQNLSSSYKNVGSDQSNTLEERRAAVLEYFTTSFSEEFKKQNAGEATDMSAVVQALPDYAINLQYHYIAQNNNPLGSKNALDAAPGDTTDYTRFHSEFHPVARKIVEQLGLYDFFLVNLEGDVVYTYFKEADYGTSLVDGPYSGANIGDAFAASRETDDPNELYLADYRPYLPSYDAQASFLSSPVYAGNGAERQKIGVLIVQLPIDQINKIATFDNKWKDAGLGASGQSVVLGGDGFTRSISREATEKSQQYLEKLRARKVNEAFLKQIQARNTDIGILRYASEISPEIEKGTAGTRSYINHLGTRVLGSYAPLEILGNQWTLISEINQDEAFLPVDALLRNILIAALATAVILGLLAYLLSSRLAKSINTPIAFLQKTVQEVTSGNLDARTGMKPTDELGQLGNAFDNLLDERVSSLVQSAHENEVLNNSVIEIMQSLGQLAQNDLTIKVPVTGDVTGAISDAINFLTTETSGALRQVLSISGNVAKASTQVRQRASEVMTAAELNGKEVSAASRELEGAAVALNEIASQAQSANEAAERAIGATSQALKIVSETVAGVSTSRDQIRETEKRLKRLGERSQEITTVVNIINQIAERTSVLALNAGMQAAAAGEAGRGFALVADEVKRLAENARDATRQIGTLVNGIQADSGDTIRTMNDTITQVVEISKLAERAGEQMEKTLRATDGLVDSVREIASTTATQARASDTLLQRAQNIEKSNNETMAQLGSQREETARLMQYSKSLIDTVRVFKLPGEAQ